MSKIWNSTIKKIPGKNLLNAFTLLEVVLSVLIGSIAMVALASGIWSIRLADRSLQESILDQQDSLILWRTLETYSARVYQPWWSGLETQRTDNKLRIPGLDGNSTQVLTIENNPDGTIILHSDDSTVFTSKKGMGTVSLWPDELHPQGISFMSLTADSKPPLIFRFGGSPW